LKVVLEENKAKNYCSGNLGNLHVVDNSETGLKHEDVSRERWIIDSRINCTKSSASATGISLG